MGDHFFEGQRPFMLPCSVDSTDGQSFLSLQSALQSQKRMLRLAACQQDDIVHPQISVASFCVVLISGKVWIIFPIESTNTVQAFFLQCAREKRETGCTTAGLVIFSSAAVCTVFTCIQQFNAICLSRSIQIDFMPLHFSLWILFTRKNKSG